MHVETLETRCFRNLQKVSLSFSVGTVVLVGQNGQGKTNLLEAIGVVCTGRSFRNAGSKELIAHKEEQAKLSARIVRHDVRHDMTVEMTQGGKAVRVDGRLLRQTTRLLELVNMVAFFPEDLRIVKAQPDVRRRFLDRAIANHRSDFVKATLAYHATLRSRNALLKSRTALDPALLSVYDEQLVHHGSIMQECRVETLERLMPLAKERLLNLSIGKELTLSWTSGLPGVSDQEMKMAFTNKTYCDTFLEHLKRTVGKDKARGMTTVGPHRADVTILLDGVSARDFASQGQQRAIVLSLKLAELAYLESQLDTAPLLLLDDVSSELDQERTKLLFEAIGTLKGQVFVTTTGATTLPLPRGTQTFSVHDGGVERC